MPNPKLDAAQRSLVEKLFDTSAPAARAPLTRVPPAAVGGGPEAAPEPEQLVRKSYVILRGRIEALPSLELVNRQGETRLFPWSYFGGANMDHPGELVLIFDGPEGSSRVTVSGRRLDLELLAGVKSQRVSLIRELDDLAAAAVAHEDPAAPVVTGIWVKGGGREWGRGAARPR
jgi:hypothetical protein